MKRRFFLAVFWFLFGCDGRFVQIPDQDPPIVSCVVDADGSLSAFDLPENSSVQVSAETAIILFYDRPLSDFGLAPGPVPSEPGHDCALTKPAHTLFVAASQDVIASIDPPETVLDGLVPDRSMVCDECVSFEQTRISLQHWFTDTGTTSDAATRPSSAAWLESGNALIGRTWGGLFAVDTETARELRGCETLSSRELFAIGGDEFFVGADRALVRVRVNESSLSCTQTASMSDALIDGPILDIDGAWTEGDRELFLRLGNGALLRYSDAGLERVGALPLGSRPSAPVGGVARVAPGSALVTAGLDQVGYFEDGTFRVESPDLFETPSEDVETVASIPGLGPMFGTSRGRIFVRRSRLWIPLDSPLEGDIGSITPFRHGYVATGQGILIQGTQDERFCEPFGPITGARHNGVSTLTRDDAVFLADMVLSASERTHFSEPIWLFAR